MAKLTEDKVVRWACYAGFTACFLMLMFAVTFNGRWVASAIGTAVLGFFSYGMYRAEQNRRENVSVVRAAQSARAGGAGRFDFGDEDEK